MPERIAPGHPEQKGSHEQFHAVLKAETARPPAATGQAQQQRFDRFRLEYNAERPHEALGNEPPASRYEPSRRALPPRLPPLEYPGHLEVRLVDCNGDVSWAGERLFVGTVLAGQPLAFEEVDDGIWTVQFATIVLGRLDDRQLLHSPDCPVHGGALAGFAGSRLTVEEKKKRMSKTLDQLLPMSLD